MATNDSAAGGKNQTVNDANTEKPATEQATTLELYATLLASFKDMTAKMSTYDKVISDLAKKIDGTPPQQPPTQTLNPATTAPTLTNTEPEFGSLFSSGGTGDSTKPKKGNRQIKNRTCQSPRRLPPVKCS